MQKLIESVFIFFIVGSLAACNVNDLSIFDSSSCSPPCWSNITPGSSTYQEVIRNLKSNPKVEVATIESRSMTSPNDALKWNFKNSGNESGRVIIKNGVVSEINLAPNPVAIEEMIKHFGEPEKIFAEYFGGEAQYVAIVILYPQKGLAFGMTLRPNENYGKVSIRPSDSVLGVTYFSPEDFRDFMENNRTMLKVKPELIDQGLQPWAGYGNVQYITADNQ